MTRTALVTVDSNEHIVIRRDNYKNQAAFANDLRDNGFKVVKIWNGDISDYEVTRWYTLNRG